MALHVLIAEPRDIIRAGIRTIFLEDKRVTSIYEATTKEDLQTSLSAHPLDLVVVNQSLLTNFTNLPRGRFIVLTAELDIVTFQEAYKHGAKGYLLENAPAELFRVILSLNEGAFLIEPSMTTQIIEHMSTDPRFTVKEELLTPREKEIIRLLREGIGRSVIAKQLHISEATLKTHIKNITRKREISPS